VTNILFVDFTDQWLSQPFLAMKVCRFCPLWTIAFRRYYLQSQTQAIWLNTETVVVLERVTIVLTYLLSVKCDFVHGKEQLLTDAYKFHNPNLSNKRYIFKNSNGVTVFPSCTVLVWIGDVLVCSVTGPMPMNKVCRIKKTNKASDHIAAI